ncbi:hypothetical protein FKR81_39625 [Lentzea tibetensis]|uniref:Uncharacterized protein n=1 Tax=Lentzea tibetensis TaxID=2591470 RepID=A0A563EHV5_9PSEU|nr:hypothetical protein [Lentzea tibetensis]TWP45194.1 hypothetical protein FKR81_39625 [Lentzea tibetensis]
MDEQPGKHRLDAGAAAPVAGGGNEVPQPRRRPVDPLSDTDGLRKFNIGLVPASVTPPRTWKRAAWFAVLSSAGVLIGLTIAAAKLVGANGPVERIGLPGYPSDIPIITGIRENNPPASTAGQRPTGTRAPASAPVQGTGGSSAAPDRTGGATARPTTQPPIVTTLPGGQVPVVDGGKIAERTEKFYREMATNADTAMALTTDNFKANTEALLEGRLADVSLIEVKEIAVDPSQGLTVSLLQVTKKDGSVSTEKRELRFTLTDLPLINGERLSSGG